MTILRTTITAAALLVLTACNQNKPTEADELPTDAGATAPAASVDTSATAGQAAEPVPDSIETDAAAAATATAATQTGEGALTTESQTADPRPGSNAER